MALAVRSTAYRTSPWILVSFLVVATTATIVVAAWPYNTKTTTKQQRFQQLQDYTRRHQRLPLPRIVHARLPQTTSGSRILIIGDVHGCIDELLELTQQQLQRCDTVILVGDLVNKGPASLRVLQHVLSQNHWHVVRGNHDNSVLKAALLHQTHKHTDWLWDTNGQCVLSMEQLLAMAEWPYTLAIPQYNVRVVHAGLVPAIPLHAQSVEGMVTMRNVVARDNRLYEPTASTTTGIPWVDAWTGPEHVVFGHDAVRGLQQQTPYATGLDTGACYGKHLTGLVLPSWDIVQVPSQRVYCVPKNMTATTTQQEGDDKKEQ